MDCYPSRNFIIVLYLWILFPGVNNIFRGSWAEKPILSHIIAWNNHSYSVYVRISNHINGMYLYAINIMESCAVPTNESNV